DLNGQCFGFLHATVTVAFGARIFNQRTATMTVRTGLLHREKALAHLHLTGTVTGWAGLWLRPRFRAAAVANVIRFQRRSTDVFGDAPNGFFKRRLHLVAQVCAARRALTTTSAAEDIAKYITRDIAAITAAAEAVAIKSTAAHAALFKGCVTVL